MNRIALAVAAHPDDIEFMMGGTMALLGRAGWQLHSMNIANGSCGTDAMDRESIVRVRTAEARTAAEALGAQFHPPLVDDIEVLYDLGLIRKLAAIVRQVRPAILLLPSPQDYMEDHMNASRVMVTAAFCRNMRNFVTDPPEAPIAGELAVYHAMPYGLRDQLRRPVQADFCVDVSSVMDAKRKALACHASQRQWLDRSQGVDSYLRIMEEMSAEMGRQSGCGQFAEGWRRHSHMGFGAEAFDPLGEALAPWISREEKEEAPTTETQRTQRTEKR
jgi:LmbE family N-acetylglucosaminyl deacetylase